MWNDLAGRRAEIVREIPKLNIPSRFRDRAMQLGAIMSKIAKSVASDETELNDLLKQTPDLELRRLKIEQIDIILDPLIELADALHAEDTPNCEKVKKLIIHPDPPFDISPTSPL